jgi:hypothetical protein
LRDPDDPEKVLVILFSEDSTRWHAGSLQYTVIGFQPKCDCRRRPRRQWPWTGFYIPARARGSGPLPRCRRAKSWRHVSNGARHSRALASARGTGHARGR